MWFQSYNGHLKTQQSNIYQSINCTCPFQLKTFYIILSSKVLIHQKISLYLLSNWFCMLASFLQINLFIHKKMWVFYRETFAWSEWTVFHIFISKILLKKKIQHPAFHGSWCAPWSIALLTPPGCVIWLLWVTRRTRNSPGPVWPM